MLTADALIAWIATGSGDGNESVATLPLREPPRAIEPVASVADGMLTMAAAGGHSLAITSDGTSSGQLHALLSLARSRARRSSAHLLHYADLFRPTSIARGEEWRPVSDATGHLRATSARRGAIDLKFSFHDVKIPSNCWTAGPNKARWTSAKSLFRRADVSLQFPGLPVRRSKLVPRFGNRN